MSSIFELKVYYEDTDFSGVVYHANYLKFIERARSDLILTGGFDQLKLRKNGINFVVRRLSATFLKPAHFQDSLSVKTIIRKIGGASINLEQKIIRKGACLFVAEVELALVSDFRPMRIPREMRDKIVALTQF